MYKPNKSTPFVQNFMAIIIIVITNTNQSSNALIVLYIPINDWIFCKDILNISYYASIDFNNFLVPVAYIDIFWGRSIQLKSHGKQKIEEQETRKAKRENSHTVMNCGGSSRLDEPRIISLFSFVVNLWQTRSWKHHLFQKLCVAINKIKSNKTIQITA